MSDGDDYYFSYEDLNVHQLMLRDRHRTETYKQAIFSLQECIKDKVVMDVGTGTGILSIFCAQAGAKKVYAVEASRVAKLAQKTIEDNNLSHIIQVIHDHVEEVELPFGEKVDVLVSEWMGFYLLHEGMLNSVIAARNKHLKPNGKMLPEIARLYSCPCSLPSEFDFWTDVYGVNMSSVGEETRKTKRQHPEIMEVRKEDLLSKPTCVLELDLKTVTVEDVDAFSTKCVATAVRDGRYQGLVLWFSCLFPVPNLETQPVVLSTSPEDQCTHWKQTVLVLPQEINVTEDEPIAWELKLKRSVDNPRQYSIEFIMLDPEKEQHPIPCYCHLTKCIVTRTFLECEKEPQVEDSESQIIDFC
ncbi:uncharacterized protein Art8 isoform X2 [Anabrus simplex]